MSEWLRRRLFWTVVLLLISLGSGGLAAAIDRPHTDAQRPELGWRADQLAEPWLTAMLLELEPVEQSVAELSGAGRQVLVQLAAPAGEEIEAGLASGEASLVQLANRLADLEQLRTDEPAGAQPWRLGEQRRERVARIDAAIEACRGLDQSWREVREAAQLALIMLDSLERHDQLLLDALAAGREARWADATGLIGEALPRLDDVQTAGLAMGPEGLPPLTAELLDGHRAHGRALLALYGYLEGGGSLDDPEVAPLRVAVDQARVPLPTPAAARQAVMAETALPIVSAQLVELEDARGRVADALQPPDDEQDDER